MNKRLKLLIEKKFDGKNKAFSKALGISPQHLNAYLSGRSNPGAEILEKIGKLGINVHWLVTGEGEIEIMDPDDQLKRLIDENSRLKALVSNVAESLEQYIVNNEHIIETGSGKIKISVHEDKNAKKGN